MKTKAIFFVVILCQLLLILSGCGAPDTPEVVTQKFWEAVESGKAKQVKKFVSAKDKATMNSLDEVLPISNVLLGKIVIDGTHASVDTNVTLDGDQSMELPIKTHLLKEGNRWTVDYERTIHTITAAGKVAAVINQFKDFGAALRDGIGRSVDELEKTLPSLEKELLKMEEQIQQAVPELKSRFQNFSKQLEQALNTPPSTSNEEPATDDKPNASDAQPNLELPSTPQSPLTDEKDNPPILAEELADIEEEILKTVPQLKSQIQDFVQELQEALKLPPDTTPADAEPEGTIEI